MCRPLSEVFCQELSGDIHENSTLPLQINDKYEFPDELDLDLEDGKWLSENADRSVRNLYKLHSVLVHSGGVHGGHYYAYIQPDRKRWLKFDDERVRLPLNSQALHGSQALSRWVLR